ncbi:MAG TPA: DUF1579 domain-containing protein [Pirellulaceae bacterium]|nr:DUF1579 domain-containing protein [Pirellulaceae bacterium]
MQAQPQQEHHWLQKLVGQWNVEMEYQMGPDSEPGKNTGTESVRSLGGLWTIGEGRGQSPEGGEADSIMTLGYDPVKQKFVGTFIASMMAHLWPYEGTLDATGKVLTLESEGPDVSGGPTMAKYRDVIEFLSDDHRTLSSHIVSADGTPGKPFMVAHYRRVK